MFGYIRPEKDELKLREYELYKSVYCGLCKTMGKEYGIAARLTLSYDCTVLAMLSLSLKDESCRVHNGRCVVNPLKKCKFCSGSGDSFQLAGAVSVIMTRYKLIDNIEDGGFFKRLAARILKGLLNRSYRKAKKTYPQIDRLCIGMMEQQKAAEQSDSGVDKSADPTAQMLSALCRSLSEDAVQQQVLSSFGYHLGRWIYIMDAADDLEKDFKKGNFNPFRQKYEEAPERVMLYCNDVLNMTVAQLTMAYELLELSSYKEILDNIVCHGLSFQQKYHLFVKKELKQHRKKKQKKRKTDYYEYLSHGDSR